MLLLLFLECVNGVSNVKIVGCSFFDCVETSLEPCSSPKRLLAVEFSPERPAKLSRELDFDKPARFSLEFDLEIPLPLVARLPYDGCWEGTPANELLLELLLLLLLLLPFLEPVLESEFLLE